MFLDDSHVHILMFRIDSPSLVAHVNPRTSYIIGYLGSLVEYPLVEDTCNG